MSDQPKDHNYDSLKHPIKRSIETGLTVVSVRADDILEIRFKVDEYEVDVKDQTEILNAIFQLTNGGKNRHHIMVIPGLYGGITKEAREKEMFKSTIFKDQLSISIIAQSLPQRMLGKFYYNFKKDKPSYPFMFFANEEGCLQWIKKLS